MNLRQEQYSPRGVGRASRLDRSLAETPRRSRLEGWEGIDVATKRSEGLPESIVYRMRVVKGRFDILGDHMDGVKVEHTLRAIARVRRLIGESISNKVRYADDLRVLRELEDKIK